MRKTSPERGSGVSTYLREIREYPNNAGTETHDLVTTNLRYVVRIAGEYRNLGLPFGDLVSEGNIGLIEAARRFDPARGAKFISYATWWIRKSILRAVSQNANMVRIPEYQAKRVRDVRNTRRMLARELGREAGSEEISRAMSVTVARVDGLLQMQLRELSLDDKVGKEGDTTVLDRLVDERSVDPEEEMIRRQNKVLLKRALRSLSRRQLSVIVDRFGLEGGRAHTLREIGERLGMSREGVRQIETQARRRLRKAMDRRRGRLPARPWLSPAAPETTSPR